RVDFYLRVFDMACEGKLFRDISSELQSRISTVKSAFLAARRNIFGPGAGPSKREAALVDLGPRKHLQNCPTSRAARRLQRMCPKAQRYGQEDHRGQIELTGHDTVRGDNAMKESEGMITKRKDGVWRQVPSS